MIKKYEASIVFAFSNKKEKAHGNPALIVFVDDSDKLDDKERALITENAKVSINGENPVILPIISFISKIDDINFKIRHFLPNREVSSCGHGTVASTKAIIEKYGKIGNEYIFHLNKSFKENEKNPIYKVEVGEDNFILYPGNDTDFYSIDENDDGYKIIQKNLGDNFIDGTLYKTGLDDYICLCENAKQLRETIILKENLKKLRNKGMNYRIFVVVAPSDIDGYDYETTVFSDELPPPVYKDPACGSANREVPKLLKLTLKSGKFPLKYRERFENKFKQKEQIFKMFYPYRFADQTAKIKGIKGGIQEVRYSKEQIAITCCASDVQNIKITIDGKKIEFKQ
ncbi:MAG: PhzF family phenazine biosynthesis protein [Rickettsiales bacterium]|jgi:PhzF family phenazine biosynthesis protein|nr:PhzF family phenazine biosynthesis protein [Rickettsiales bacterium]